jgi:hypothetical protein
VDDPQDLLRQRRIWGVPPDAVAIWVSACLREHKELCAHQTALETRLAHIVAERDAVTTASAALKDRITRLEAENAERKDRPEMIRAEAIQFVVDAYAEGQQARAQTAREIAAEKEAAREAMTTERAAVQEEIAWIRRDFDAERRKHEETLAALQQQRAETIASLDAIRRSLLAQPGRMDPVAPDIPGLPCAPALETVAEIAGEIPPETPTQRDPSPTLPDPDAPSALIEAGSGAWATNSHRATASENTMLARALDELEAILRGNRKAGSET